MGFNAVLEVQTSKELRVCGAIGHVTSLNKKTPGVSADTVLNLFYLIVSLRRLAFPHHSTSVVKAPVGPQNTRAHSDTAPRTGLPEGITHLTETRPAARDGTGRRGSLSGKH